MVYGLRLKQQIHLQNSWKYLHRLINIDDKSTQIAKFFALEDYAQAAEHLKKVKMKEHIAVITQLTGGV